MLYPMIKEGQSCNIYPLQVLDWIVFLYCYVLFSRLFLKKPLNIISCQLIDTIAPWLTYILLLPTPGKAKAKAMPIFTLNNN
jgi:hypothetical protein